MPDEPKQVVVRRRQGVKRRRSNRELPFEVEFLLGLEDSARASKTRPTLHRLSDLRIAMQFTTESRKTLFR